LVDASRLGVPQARKRLIIIGIRRDLLQSTWWKIDGLKRRLERILNNSGNLIGRYPLTPLEAFESRPLPDTDNRYAEVMKEYEGVAEEVKTRKAMEWKKNVWEKLTFEAVEDYLTVNQINPESREEIDAAFVEHGRLLKELGYYGVKVAELKCPDGSSEIPSESPRVLERMKRIPPGENHEFVRGTPWEVEGRGMSLIYRRIHPLQPAYTVVAHGGGGTWGYHYEKGRSKLSSRERARLQTFPDWFTFEGSFSQVRAQIGEAVPPLMAKRIAEAVAETLDELA
jgi:DNA (cytosine-5)-methyltransferase 1